MSKTDGVQGFSGWNEIGKLKLENKELKAERDALLAQLSRKEETIAEMSELCLTVGEVNKIKAEAVKLVIAKCYDSSDRENPVRVFNSQIYLPKKLLDQYAERILQGGE